MLVLVDDDTNNINSQYRALLRETYTCPPPTLCPLKYSPPKKMNIEVETKQFSVLLLLSA